MTAFAVRRSRRRALAIPSLALTLLAIVVLVTVGVGALTSPGPAPTAAGSRALQAQLLGYQSRILPVVRDAGSIEILGMRAGLRDIKNNRPFALTEARAWKAGLTSDAGQLAAVTPPAALASVHAAIRRSLRLLVRAAVVFTRAARAPSPHQRMVLLHRGIRIGERADRVYDAGSAELQALRAQAGLPATPDFPNPSAGTS